MCKECRNTIYHSVCSSNTPIISEYKCEICDKKIGVGEIYITKKEKGFNKHAHYDCIKNKDDLLNWFSIGTQIVTEDDCEDIWLY